MKRWLILLILLLVGCGRLQDISPVINIDTVNIDVNVTSNEEIDVPIILDGYNGGSILGLPLDISNYWKLDEDSGDALDSEGSFIFAQVGTVPSDIGLFSKSRGAFSTSNYLRSPGSSSLFAIEQFVVDGFFKTSITGTTQVIIGDYVPNPLGWDVLIDSSNKLNLRMAGLSLLTSTGTYTDGEWHHFLCGQRETSGVNERRLYIDGVLDQQAAGSAFTATAGALPKLGITKPSLSWADPFGGLLCDIAFWDLRSSVISWDYLAEVARLRYNGGLGMQYTDSD